MSFVSLDRDYRGQSISSRLIDKLFELADSNNKGIRITNYTEDGLQKVKHVVDRNKEKYPNMKVIFA